MKNKIVKYVICGLLAMVIGVGLIVLIHYNYFISTEVTAYGQTISSVPGAGEKVYKEIRELGKYFTDEQNSLMTTIILEGIKEKAREDNIWEVWKKRAEERKNEALKNQKDRWELLYEEKRISKRSYEAQMEIVENKLKGEESLFQRTLERIMIPGDPVFMHLRSSVIDEYVMQKYETETVQGAIVQMLKEDYEAGKIKFQDEDFEQNFQRALSELSQ